MMQEDLFDLLINFIINHNLIEYWDMKLKSSPQ